MNKEIYMSAFINEFEKFARYSNKAKTYGRKKMSIKGSFVSGLDPTGSKTFSIAQKAKRHKLHKPASVAGGAAGTAVVLPSMISGFSEAGKALSKGKGKMKVFSAVAGFVKGARKPIKSLHKNIKAKSFKPEAKKTYTMFGASAAAGGASRSVQYNQGKKSGDQTAALRSKVKQLKSKTK